MSSENILRVKQALEIQPSFTYVLTDKEVAELEQSGYDVVKRPMKPATWLFDCTITRAKINKRIVVRQEGDGYVVAVNTMFAGTIKETIQRTQSLLMLVVIVRGYLNTWRDSEVHPASKQLYDYIAEIVDSWKDQQ